MDCFLCGGRRKTKRVTVPPGRNTLSVGPAAHATQQQQALGPYAASVPTSRQHHVQCHIYQYCELQAATADFSERNIIGEGGFGRVYKGRLPNGTLAAVKRLDRHGLQGDLEFNVEVSIMAGLHHAHVVPLLGSCCEADQRVAVFEYMPHGNLRDLLDGKIAAARHFNWPARLNVLLGVAKGLAYLHEGTNPAVVHRDLKSSNILIDGVGQARICDFGLARHKMLLYSQPPPGPPPGGIMTGTFGYMAPEYATSGQTTDKSDVYAFGVVVLEMMTGMQAVDARRPTGCEALPQLLQPALQAVQLMQGNLDPALNRHASLPAAQLAALCEVAASCLEPQPTDRPAAARLVTYLQKLLKSTDSANTPVSRHERTVSSPPAGAPSPAHHPSASDTPRDYHQQPTSGGASSSSPHQQQPQYRQQTHQQHRHRPAQSMPKMGFTASPDWTADTAASTQAGRLPLGHDLRSSAGYGNELGIPGPSRRLTPLALGLHAASLCSQPAAAAPATSPAPEDHAAVGASSAASLPLAQEGPSSLPSMLPLQASPTRPDMMTSRGEGSLLDDTELAFGGGQAPGRAGLMEAARDVRDSAWGPSCSSQPPSAPLSPIRSSAQSGDHLRSAQAVLRPINGHRPTQSAMSGQGKSSTQAGHLRTASSPYDQSLHQLVQSRSMHPAIQSQDAPRPGSGQTAAQASLVSHGLSDDQERPLPQQLTQQRSGNPFASDSTAEGTASGDGMLISSASAPLVSGNPFRSSADADAMSIGQGRSGEGQQFGVDQQASDSLAWGQSGSPTASCDLLKNAEMSPLQNGLIRAWPSPCKLQPPQVMARSWHHFLSASTTPRQAASHTTKQQSSLSQPASQRASARVGVCLVCLDASRDWQMVPCGHAAACKTCAEQLQQHRLPCPVCRAAVTSLCYRQFQQTYVGSAVPANGHAVQQEQVV